MARTVAGFSAWLFVQDVTGRVQTKTDEVVIGASLPVAFVTPYSFARRLSEIPQVFTDQFLKVLVPLASETHAKGDFGLLQRVYLTGTRMTLAMFLPMACALGVLMRPVLQVWVGAEYAAYAPVGTILLLASLIDTSQWPAGSVLQGMGKYRALVLMSAAAACANLALSIALIRVLGLTGVALGTLIPTTVVCSALVLPYMLRTMKIGLARFVREALAPALVPCAPTLLVLLVANRFHPASLASIGAVGGLGLLVYWIVYLRVTAPTSERRLAAGLLTRPRTGLSSAG